MALAAGALVLAGCSDAKYDTLSQQAYILQTKTDANSSVKLTIGNDPVTTDLNVRLSDFAASDCHYKLVYDANALAAFNKRNETNYEMLPESSFTLSSTDVTVKQGESVSENVDVTVSPFTDAMKSSGKKYALAFRLEGTDGSSSVLPSGSVLVYVLDRVVIQPVIQLNRQHYITKESIATPLSLTAWTLEFNVNKDVLKTGVGQGNNQACFSAGPDEIYVRFGDAPIEGDLLQIKTQGTQMNSKTHFSQNKWYHIAFVCTGTKLYLYVNGVLDNSMDMPGKTTNFSKYTICSSSSYWLGNGLFSEFRFWQVARSQKEIANNMYVVDPTTEGLVFYYKFDEGTGKTVHDASGHGNDAEVTGDGTDPVWFPDVRIDGK